MHFKRTARALKINSSQANTPPSPSSSRAPSCPPNPQVSLLEAIFGKLPVPGEPGAGSGCSCCRDDPGSHPPGPKVKGEPLKAIIYRAADECAPKVDAIRIPGRGREGDWRCGGRKEKTPSTPRTRSHCSGKTIRKNPQLLRVCVFEPKLQFCILRTPGARA